MNRKDLLKEMKDGIGNKDPILFFEKMVDVFNLMFDKIEHLENQVHRAQIHAALAIEWEPKIASEMLAKQANLLRQADKETFHVEISALKIAYAENKVTQNYIDFCNFWVDTLGWHPFLEYNNAISI